MGNEFDNKWNHQFEINSINSNNTPIRGIEGAINQQSSQYNQANMTSGHQFASPAQPALTASTKAGGGWNMSGSFYNSPFFLIPTNTTNVQHRSAAFHDNNLRHINS